MPKGKKRKHATPPVGDSAPNKRNHVLRREGTRKHATFSPKTDTKSSGFIEPISGTDLNKDHVIQFEFVTMGGYWLLPEDPIFASYKVKFTNQGHVELAKGATTDNRKPYEKVAKSAYYDGSSLELACGAHLNPHLGLAGFFNGAEVTVNGETVSTADYGQNFYQTLNRGFTSKKIRRRYTGSDAELLPKGAEANMNKWPAGYKQGIDLLDVGGATAEDSNYIGQRFSIDSAFLLSCPKNLTLLSVNESKGIGSEAVQAYTLLKPGTKVCIKLFKTDPGGRNVGNYNTHSATGGYSSATNMDVAGTDSKIITPKNLYLDAVLELSQLNIMYEVYNFVDTPKTIAGVNIKYTKDSFKLQTQNLTSGQREVKKSFEISGNTKVAYIFFPWHFQLHFDPTTKKATEYMLDFPANLHNITVYLNSRPYRWTNGLTGLSPLDPTKTNATTLAKPSYGHSFANLYFREQSKLGIIDNDFNEIFPKAGQRWKDVLVLEFTEDKLEKLNTLMIDCLFDEPYSPAKRMIACMTVFEEDIIDSGGVWGRKTHKS